MHSTFSLINLDARIQLGNILDISWGKTYRCKFGLGNMYILLVGPGIYAWWDSSLTLSERSKKKLTVYYMPADGKVYTVLLCYTISQNMVFGQIQEKNH